MAKLNLIKRIEFDPAASSIYVSSGDIYSDGESCFVFLTLVNADKARHTDAVAKITPYDENKKPMTSFGVRLDLSRLKPRGSYAYPDPVPLPPDCEAFNFEFLKIDGVKAPAYVPLSSATSVAEASLASKKEEAPAEAPRPVAEEKPIETPKQEAPVTPAPAPAPAPAVESAAFKPVKRFTLTSKRINGLSIGIASGVALVGLFFGFALSNLQPNPVNPDDPGASSQESRVDYVDDVGVNYQLNHVSFEAKVVSFPTENEGNLEIPSYVRVNETDYAVIEIAEMAFAKCSLNSISAPYVRYVGENAFVDAQRLERVSIGQFVSNEDVRVYANAFENNPFLNLVEIGGNAKIAKQSFASNPLLRFTGNVLGFRGSEMTGSFQFEAMNFGPQSDVNLSQCEVTEIALTFTQAVNIPSSFAANSTELTSVRVDTAFDYAIGSYAFSGCTKLKDYPFSRCVRIGDYAFSGCSSLLSAEKTDDIREIGTAAFASSGLLTIYLYGNVELSQDMFPSACKVYLNGNLVDLEPKEITPELTFDFDPIRNGYVLSGFVGSFDSVAIPDEYQGKPVVAIGSGALYGIDASSVTGGRYVTYIGPNAFSNSSISSVSVGQDEIIELAPYCFNGASVLSSFATQASAEVKGSLDASRAMTFTAHSLSGDTSSFRADQGLYSITLAHAGNAIMDYLPVDGIKAMEVLDFTSDSLTRLVDNAASTTLQNLSLQKTEGTFVVNASAFENYSALLRFDFSAVTRIEANAFKNTGFVSIEFPAQIEEIGESAFASSLKLDYVSIHDGTVYHDSSFPSYTTIDIIE